MSERGSIPEVWAKSVLRDAARSGFWANFSSLNDPNYVAPRIPLRRRFRLRAERMRRGIALRIDPSIREDLDRDW